jgi:hypothetical protein
MRKIHRVRTRNRIKRKPRYDARAKAAERNAARRELCSALTFWKFCGAPACKRAKACAGDGEACFRNFWPALPEDVKVMVRAHMTASAAGLPKPQVAAEVERAHRRWCEVQAQAAAEAEARAVAAPPALAPQPVVIAPRVPRATPRVRVL